MDARPSELESRPPRGVVDFGAGELGWVGLSDIRGRNPITWDEGRDGCGLPYYTPDTNPRIRHTRGPPPLAASKGGFRAGVFAQQLQYLSGQRRVWTSKTSSDLTLATRPRPSRRLLPHLSIIDWARGRTTQYSDDLSRAKHIPIEDARKMQLAAPGIRSAGVSSEERGTLPVHSQSSRAERSEQSSAKRRM